MKITVQSYDDSEPDCRRRTFYTTVKGKEIVLAPCALEHSRFTREEIEAKARGLFGPEVEIEYENAY